MNLQNVMPLSPIMGGADAGGKFNNPNRTPTDRRMKTSLLLCASVILAATLAPAQQVSSTTQTSPAGTPSVFIQIRADRMEPSSLSVKAGPIIFLVQNRSSAPNITLRLDRTGGGNVNAASLQPNQHHYLQAYYLLPGTYVLSEAKHKAWTCTITVK